jgi:hypothetical protein
MPKVEYTKSKGLVQKTGSGFSVSDVPVVEHVQTLTTSGAADISAHGTHIITSGGEHTITLLNGTYAGQKKLVVVDDVTTGNITLKAETAGNAGVTETVGGAAMNAAGEHALLMWIGDRWVTLSTTIS